MRETIRKIIIYFMVLLFGYLTFSNISHMYYLRSKNEINYSDDTVLKEMKYQNDILAKNIKLLDQIKKTNHLDENQVSNMKKTIEKVEDGILKSGFLKLDGKDEFTNVDVYKLLLSYTEIQSLELVQAFDTIIKQDSNCGFRKEEITTDYLESMISLSPVDKTLMNDFQYQVKEDDLSSVKMVQVKTIYYGVLNRIELANKLATYLIKDGEVNE